VQLPGQLRIDPVAVALPLGLLTQGDGWRIDSTRAWLRMVTDALIAFIALVSAVSVRLAGRRRHPPQS